MAKTSSTPFVLAEQAIISLYDGGVLSPAVLERLVAAFSSASPDWNTEPTARSVDGRSLHEIVTLTMTPGESLRAARKSFLSVIEHMTGSGKTKKTGRASSKDAHEEDEEEDEPAAEDEDNAELARQLSGSSRGAQSRRRTSGPKGKDVDTSAGKPTRTAVFNPLLNAAAPRRSRS